MRLIVLVKYSALKLDTSHGQKYFTLVYYSYAPWASGFLALQINSVKHELL